MAIQIRRGPASEFDATKMVSGELAVSTDGTRKVWATGAAGDSWELPSTEEVEQMVENAEVEVDPTLSVEGMAADAKATGDALNDLKADLTTETFRATKTIAVDDFDNYMTNGAYLVNSGSLAHRPDTTEQGTLLVFAYNTTGNYGYVQIYITNSQNKIFYRAYVGNNAWKNWIEISSVAMVSDVTGKAFTERSVATSDLNNYLVNGAYLVNSTISNAPYESANGLLTVFTWNQTNAYGLMQMFVSKDASIPPYYRFRWNSVWSGWMTFAPQIDIDVVETSKNANVLNPSNFTLKGYISVQDGTTFTSNNDYMCTNDFIDVPFGTSTIYAKFPQTENNNRICCFLFYDAEGNYTGSYSGRFTDADVKVATLSGQIDVTKIKFWVNKTTVSGGSNDVCISFTEPSAFIAYEGEYKVDNKSLESPQIYLPLSGKKIVCFGDSIFGNKKTPFGVTGELKEITGATVYNIGFGGTDMAARSSTTWDAFSMYRLAYAIANNDFTLQDTAIEDTSAGLLAYFPKTLSLLKTIDFSDVDYITIAYGTNDFTGNIVLDNTDNLTDTTKFCGALRYSLQQIMSAFPHIKIFVCGQTYRFWMDASNIFIDDSDTHENGNGDKLTDFVTATKSVSDEYHVPFIDNYNIGINKINRSYYFPTNDGTHQNYLGAKLIAEHIKHELY